MTRLESPEEFQYFVDDRLIDSRFIVSGFDGGLVIVQKAMGGTVNRDYILGFQSLLHRLGELDAVLMRASLVTRVVHRRLDLEGFDYPVRLATVDTEILRKALHRSMTKTGQVEGASGGNPTKRVALEISLPSSWDLDRTLQHIQFGRRCPSG